MINLYDFAKDNKYRYVKIDGVKYKIDFSFLDFEFMKLIRVCKSKRIIVLAKHRSEYTVEENVVRLEHETLRFEG